MFWIGLAIGCLTAGPIGFAACTWFVISAENKQIRRLRAVLQRIIALYNRDKERGCFASSQDFQCGIRKGKKEAAVIAEQALKEIDHA